jgi:inner membrane protein
MIWSTHLVAGLSTLWLFEAIGLFEAGAAVGVLPVLSAEQITLIAGGAAFGSLLPDLDAAHSKIKHLSVAGIKPFYLPSQAIYQTLGHRTLLHSLKGLAGIALAASLLLPFADWRAALAIIAGYASHLALDACNPGGIPLLYPDRKKFYLLPRKWRIATGSPSEELVFALFALLALLFFLRQLSAF